MADSDPQDEIARLDEQIEGLNAQIKRCRRLVLVAVFAAAAGFIIIIAIVTNAVPFNELLMVGAAVAVLGGLTQCATYVSAASKAVKELAATEAKRSALPGRAARDPVMRNWSSRFRRI